MSVGCHPNWIWLVIFYTPPRSVPHCPANKFHVRLKTKQIGVDKVGARWRRELKLAGSPFSPRFVPPVLGRDCFPPASRDLLSPYFQNCRNQSQVQESSWHRWGMAQTPCLHEERINLWQLLKTMQGKYWEEQAWTDDSSIPWLSPPPHERAGDWRTQGRRSRTLFTQKHLLMLN